MTPADDLITARPSWPRTSDVDAPPFVHCGDSVERMYGAYCLAAVPIMAAGAWIFGLPVLTLYLSAAAGSMLADRVGRVCVRQGSRGQGAHALVMGLLLAMTLPPTTPWSVAFIGGFLGIAVGKWLLGSLGNYPWHPALVGRVLAQLLFADALCPGQWPFLANTHNLTGSLDAAQIATHGYRGFHLSPPPPCVEAWSAVRPVDHLVALYGAPGGAGEPDLSLLALVRDHLPPWSDTVWGVVGGGIGETCTVAILIAGLILLGCRCARWQLPVAAIATAGLLAAIWPVHLDGPAVAGAAANTAAATWFPVTAIRDGFPVGVALVLFHLTGGGFLLACLVIAPDPVTTPLRGRGHLLFGVGLGALAFFGRIWGLSLGSAYWAVLAMNTLAPLIDRVTRRRVFGT
jgi:electron transport complex protein RnfD